LKRASISESSEEDSRKFTLQARTRTI
jgi:hypothetical protein